MRTTVGVKVAQLTLNLLITPTRSFVREAWSGTQTVPPHISVLKISIKQASKVYEANCRTLDDSEMPQPGENLVLLVTQW